MYVCEERKKSGCRREKEKGRGEREGRKGEREKGKRSKEGEGGEREEVRKKGKVEHTRERTTTVDKFLPPSRTVLCYHLTTLQLEQSMVTLL